MPWPEAALVAVSSAFLSNYKLLASGSGLPMLPLLGLKQIAARLWFEDIWRALFG